MSLSTETPSRICHFMDKGKCTVCGMETKYLIALDADFLFAISLPTYSETLRKGKAVACGSNSHRLFSSL